MGSRRSGEFALEVLHIWHANSPEAIAAAVIWLSILRTSAERCILLGKFSQGLFAAKTANFVSSARSDRITNGLNFLLITSINEKQ